MSGEIWELWASRDEDAETGIEDHILLEIGSKATIAMQLAEQQSQVDVMYVIKRLAGKSVKKINMYMRLQDAPTYAITCEHNGVKFPYNIRYNETDATSLVNKLRSTLKKYNITCTYAISTRDDSDARKNELETSDYVLTQLII